MSLIFTAILFSLLVFQLLFTGFFLLTHPRGKRVSNVLLGSFFLTLALNLLDTLLLMTQVYHRYPALALWGSSMALLFGPFLYLHTRSVVQRDFRLSPGHLLHELPFFLLTMVSLAGYHQLSAVQKQTLLDSILRQQLPASFSVIAGFILLHFFAYLASSLRLIRRYRKALSDAYSELRDKNLNWLSSTILFFLVFFLAGTFRGFLPYTPYAAYHVAVLAVLLMGLFWFVNRFLLHALRQPDLFLGLDGEWLQETRPATVASGSGHHELLDLLKTVMETQKPYLEPELTLDELARRLEVRPKQLSSALNEGLGQHFFDYVNRYRIEAAKAKLSHPDDPGLTVLEVMYQVGFNSKSSFNTLFRKYTGQTPTEFKRASKRH